LLTHSKFMLQMSIQQWWGSVEYTSNLQSHHFSHTTPKKLKIHITQINYC